MEFGLKMPHFILKYQVEYKINCLNFSNMKTYNSKLKRCKRKSKKTRQHLENNIKFLLKSDLNFFF